jgi:hypothetical protein
MRWIFFLQIVILWTIYKKLIIIYLHLVKDINHGYH